MDLYTVGPVNMYNYTLDTYSKQLPYFRNDVFSQIVLESSDILKMLFDASEESKIVLLTTSGTGALEASIANLCGQNNKVLVINGGTFGARYIELCKRYNIEYCELNVPFSSDLSYENLL